MEIGQWAGSHLLARLLRLEVRMKQLELGQIQTQSILTLIAEGVGSFHT